MIDHNKDSLVDALGLDKQIYDIIRREMVVKVKDSMTHRTPCPDSVIFEHVYNSLKDTSFISTDPKEREINLFAAGVLTALSVDTLKNMKSPPTKSRNPIEDIKDLLNKLGGKAMGKIVFAGDVPPEIKKLASEFADTGDFKVEVTPNIPTTTQTDSENENLFVESKPSHQSMPGMNIPDFQGIPKDIEEIEDFMKQNLDKIDDRDIAFFVDVIRDCEHKCEFEHRLTCPIYKRYENME